MVSSSAKQTFGMMAKWMVVKKVGNSAVKKAVAMVA